MCMGIINGVHVQIDHLAVCMVNGGRQRKIINPGTMSSNAQGCLSSMNNQWAISNFKSGLLLVFECMKIQLNSRLWLYCHL